MTATYLQKRGFSPLLRMRYMERGWIESLGRGAYKRPGDPVDWLGAIYTLQKQLNMSIHPGGKTALSLKGASHFAPMGSGEVFVFGKRGDRLPTWFVEYPWQVTVVFKPTNLFAGDVSGFLSDFKHKELPIKIASRELAVLQMLYYVPDRQGFMEAFALMENLATLRPKVVQKLLTMCQSVKVKRLFLFMANRANHAWFGKLDVHKLDLGKGKRVIVKGGVLDKTYGITVPRELMQ